jgi:hypothetical protein
VSQLDPQERQLPNYLTQKGSVVDDTSMQNVPSQRLLKHHRRQRHRKFLFQTRYQQLPNIDGDILLTSAEGNVGLTSASDDSGRKAGSAYCSILDDDANAKPPSNQRTSKANSCAWLTIISLQHP